MTRKVSAVKKSRELVDNKTKTYPATLFCEKSSYVTILWDIFFLDSFFEHSELFLIPYSE